MGFWKKQTPSVTAAAGPVARRALVNTARVDNYNTDKVETSIHMLQTWQREMDVYDEYGPGFVGSALDLVADKVVQGGPAVLLREVPIAEDSIELSIFRGVWTTFRNEYESPKDLLHKASRIYAKIGVFYIIKLDSERRKGTCYVAHPSELEFTQTYVAWTHPQTGDKYKLDPNDVYRVWQPLDSKPRQSTSDYKRAIPHIREYVSVKLRQDTDTTSPLVRNGLLHFGEGTEVYQSDNDSATDDVYDGLPDAIVDYIKLARAYDRQVYHEKRRGVDTIPFPVVGGEVNLIDLSRTNDPYIIELEAAAMKAFARATRIPTQLITEGPGVAKYDNQDAVYDALIDDAVTPIGNDVIADIWRTILFDRFVTMYSIMAGTTVDAAIAHADRLEVKLNVAALRRESYQAKAITEAYKIGAAQRDEVARVLNTSLIELPADVTEFDMWRMVTTPKVGRPANAHEARKANDPNLAVPEFNDPTAPAQITASSTNVEREFARIMEDALIGDINMQAAAAIAVQKAYDDVINRLARQISLEAKSGSDLKKQLATVPTSAEKLRIAYAAGVTTSPTALAERIEELRKELERIINDSSRHVVASVTALTGVGYALAAGAGIRQIIDEFTQFATHTLARGTVATTVPFSITRRGLSVVGGGTSEGMMAALTSPRLLSVARDLNVPSVQFRWIHGAYRAPENPDPAHLAKNNAVVAAPSDFGMIYPGDHINCTCAIRMEYA